jgi:hypothetical protein
MKPQLPKQFSRTITSAAQFRKPITRHTAFSGPLWRGFTRDAARSRQHFKYVRPLLLEKYQARKSQIHDAATSQSDPLPPIGPDFYGQPAAIDPEQLKGSESQSKVS